MASEFKGFRRTGGSGDLGRDGALFETEYEGVIIQTSVAKDWRAKVKATVSRLKEAGVRVSQLVYCTIQDVGPRADGLRRELREVGIALDIRDGSYFVDRRDESDGTRAAAQTLERLVVDPLVPATEGLTRNSSITEPDLRAGLLYLELQLHDSEGDRGLTKLSHDAIVLSTCRPPRRAGLDPDAVLPTVDAHLARRGVLGRHREQNVLGADRGPAATLRAIQPVQQADRAGVAYRQMRIRVDERIRNVTNAKNAMAARQYAVGGPH